MAIFDFHIEEIKTFYLIRHLEKVSDEYVILQLDLRLIVFVFQKFAMPH